MDRKRKYIQHSAHIPPGREGLFNLVKSTPPTLKYEPGTIVADGAQISFTIKKALEMQGPVIIGVEVDYRDNYRFMEIMRPDVLD